VTRERVERILAHAVKLQAERDGRTVSEALSMACVLGVLICGSFDAGDARGIMSLFEKPAKPEGAE
jgi:hypothetical protein